MPAAAPLKSRDSATAVSPTARATTRSGMPAANPATDYGVATATGARPDTNDPPAGYSNPPSAASDPGGF